jgi:hypothetical protein
LERGQSFPDVRSLDSHHAIKQVLDEQYLLHVRRVAAQRLAVLLLDEVIGVQLGGQVCFRLWREVAEADVGAQVEPIWHGWACRFLEFPTGVDCDVGTVPVDMHAEFADEKGGFGYGG